MSWLRRYPVFAPLLLALGLLVVVEVGWVGERWRTARGARKRLDQARRELRATAAATPAPTPENAAAIATELARTREALAELRTALTPLVSGGAEGSGLRAPERRPDAYFDIAAFVEAMRARATQAGVALKPDERFGFSTYANEAPESDRLGAVFRERLVVQHLLEALIDARPRQLLGMQREQPREPSGRRETASAGGTRLGKPSGAGTTDYFEIDPAVSARVPGVVATTAFRVSFVGHTVVLRTLLNKLAEFEMPLVVRAVEVAPADGPAEVSPRSAGVPVITPSWSRFTVTVELIDFPLLSTAAS